jgi:hypothetical protein
MSVIDLTTVLRQTEDTRYELQAPLWRASDHLDAAQQADAQETQYERAAVLKLRTVVRNLDDVGRGHEAREIRTALRLLAKAEQFDAQERAAHGCAATLVAEARSWLRKLGTLLDPVLRAIATRTPKRPAGAQLELIEGGRDGGPGAAA